MNNYNENIKLNRMFINYFSIVLFIGFQIDYLLTYLGVVVLEFAEEVNPVTGVFLNMNQKIALPIRFVLLISIVIFINLRLKYILKQNNVNTILLLVIILSIILIIVFTLHSIWIINFINLYLNN